MDLTQVIAKNISTLLEKTGRTQSELSSFLGISRQTLSNYLKGTSTIDSVRLKYTADFFGVPITELLVEPNAVRTPLMFRAAPDIYQNISHIEDRIFDYIKRHELLLSRIGGSSHFTPEQHDLAVTISGKRISINNDLNRFPSSSYKLDSCLEADIWRIADRQRKLLGMNDAGAIELIPALTQRGINIVFMKFCIPELYGVSVCDAVNGCYIFINSDEDITIERQLFTVAHEYAHLILHRPLFSDVNQPPASPFYTEFLDKMADRFAGRLLCPPAVLLPYAGDFSTSDSTLRSIVFPAVRLKHRLQISFGSLLYALSSYNMISRSVISEFYSIYDRKKEPYPIKDIPVLRELFMEKKTENIKEEIRKACMCGLQITNEDVSYYLDCDLQQAKTILKQFVEEENQSALFS